MAFGFKKETPAANEQRVVMAVEMTDGYKTEQFKYVIPRIKRSQVVIAQRDARQSAKGAKGTQVQAVASASLIGELITDMQPLDGAPEVEVLFDYLGDSNTEPFMQEVFRLATEDYAKLRAEGVEVL